MLSAKNLPRVLGAGVAAFLLLAGCGSEDTEDASQEHTGSDDQFRIDPVAQDPQVTAITAATAWLSFQPASRISVCDVAENVSLLTFTGDLSQKASHPESPECMDARPDQWEDWAQAKAEIKAIVDDAELTERTDTTAVAKVAVTQYLVYPDGGSSTFASSKHTVDLRFEGDRWKAADISDTP